MHQSSLESSANLTCVLSIVMFTLFDIIVFWPTVLRLAYVRRVGNIIQAFYSDSDQQLAKLKQRKIILSIFITIAVITIYQIIFLLVTLFRSDYREAYCLCQLFQDGSFIVGYFVGALTFILEVSAYVYFMCRLCALKTKLKYKIKEELLVMSSCWVLIRVASILNVVIPHCLYALEYYIEEPEMYINSVLEIIMFTFLIPYPLWANRKIKEEDKSISSLIYEFPEALYFWTPNFYFNLFLQKRYPQHVKYRPFIADILRYDFQIEQAISSQGSAIQTSEALKISESQHPLSRVLQLALYIRDRYLVEESKGYCNFEDQPDVLESIREKYSNLEQNLDEFLFEFVRPYIEGRLSPLYAHFIESQEFQKLKKELRAGEIFEWFLSQQQT